MRETLGHEPREAAVFVFHNRARTHVKLLWHHTRGYCLLYKRLDRGTYRIPVAIPPGAAEVAVRQREFFALFDDRLLRQARRVAREAERSTLRP